MINCQQSREFLSLKLDGELNKFELNQLKEHLSSCGSCQDYDQRLYSLHQDILSLREVSLEESLVDSLFENKPFISQGEYENKNRKEKGRRWKTWYSLATAAVFIILMIPLMSMLNNDKSPGSVTHQEMVKMDTAEEGNSMKSVEGESYGIASAAKEEDRGAPSSNEEDVKLGIASTSEEQNNDAVAKRNQTLSLEVTEDYKVVEENNQLVIYEADKEVYRTEQWNKDMKVIWEKQTENEVIYSLTQNGNQVATYKINLAELREEKVR